MSTYNFRVKAAQAVTVDGHWCEFGVADGASCRLWQKFHHPIHGFDTFTGLPEPWREGFPAGRFDRQGTPPDVVGCIWHVGLFQHTLTPWLEQYPGPVAFLAIDCDLYTGAEYVLRTLREAGRIVPGAVIVFDEYEGYPGFEEHEHRAAHEQLFPYFEVTEIARQLSHEGTVKVAYGIN